MSHRDRIRRQKLIQQAEGYLELEMPAHALLLLDRIHDPATFKGHVLYLRGEALRALGRFEDALAALDEAADQNPSSIHIRLAQGWCYKRIGQLPRAIAALEEALEADEKQAILHYNLACYHCLAGDKPGTLSHLSRAFDLDASYRDLVETERDFDPLRSDPDFRELTSVVV